MKIRITGNANRKRDFIVSCAYDLSDPKGMDMAVAYWKAQDRGKFNELEVIDQETGEPPVGDPFEELSAFYAKVK